MNINNTTTTDRLRNEALLRAAAARNKELSSLHYSQDQYLYNDHNNNNNLPNNNSTNHNSNNTNCKYGYDDATAIPEEYFSFANSTSRVSTSHDSQSHTTPLQPTNNGTMGESSHFGNAQPQTMSQLSTPAEYFSSPNFTQHPTTTFGWMAASSSVSTSPSLPQSQSLPPITDATTTTTTPTNQSTMDLASTARAEWRQYGCTKTQVLEEKRMVYPNFMVSVQGFENQVDCTNSEYTTYTIQITKSYPTNTKSNASTSTSMHTSPSASNTCRLERRYSDFWKLHMKLLQQQQQQFYTNSVLQHATFPSKHWAGRLGNWTPSKLVAPISFQSLIQERCHQLDAWLVYVVYTFYHQYPMPDVLHFLSDSYIQLLPYQQMNNYPTTNNTTTTPQQNFLQWNNPVTFTLGSSIRQAVQTLQWVLSTKNHNTTTTTPTSSTSTNTTHQNSNETKIIPLDLLHHAHGLLFLTIAKAGCVITGRVGTGLLIIKHNNNPPPPQQSPPQQSSTSSSWSAPVAVGTVGLGWGATVGIDTTHSLVVFTSIEAVHEFIRTGTLVQLGTELDIAVGTMGRSASQNNSTSRNNSHHSQDPNNNWSLNAQHHHWQMHSSYAYAYSQGFFVGISLEGSVVQVRHDVNRKFYGRTMSVSEILQYPGCPNIVAAEPMYRALDQALQTPIPNNTTTFRPSLLLSWKNTDDGKNT